MLGVPSGEVGGAPRVGVIYAENGGRVGRNGLATTQLDSAFKKHNTNTTILEIRAIRDGQSIQENKRLYLASRNAKIGGSNLEIARNKKYTIKTTCWRSGRDSNPRPPA